MAIRVLNISGYLSYPSLRIGILDLGYRYLLTYRPILSDIHRNIVISPIPTPIPIPIPIPISRFRTPLRAGGIKKVENSLEIDSIARFAVEEHNKKENAHLKFEKVVNTKHQVVCGSLYYITLEATDSGQKKVCVAKVWVKPWLNFKELQEFKAY